MRYREIKGRAILWCVCRQLRMGRDNLVSCWLMLAGERFESGGVSGLCYVCSD